MEELDTIYIEVSLYLPLCIYLFYLILFNIQWHPMVSSLCSYFQVTNHIFDSILCSVVWFTMLSFSSNFNIHIQLRNLIQRWSIHERFGCCLYITRRNLFTPRYSWNTSKVGFKHQSIYSWRSKLKHMTL